MSGFEDRLLSLGRRLFPKLETSEETDRALIAMDVLGLIIFVPALVVGAAWLVLSTDKAVLLAVWPELLALTILSVFLSRLELRFYVRLGENLLGEFGGALDYVLVWAAALLYGPVALWIWVPGRVVSSLREYAEVPGKAVRRLRVVRSALQDTAATFIAALFALKLYGYWGGSIPPEGLVAPDVPAALGGAVVVAVLTMVMNAPLFIYSSLSPAFGFRGPSRRVFLRFWATSWTWPLIILPFGVFGAAVVSDGGLPAALFFAAATVVVAVGGHWASTTARLSMERSRELTRLQRLARSLLEQSPGELDLPGLLQEHAATMFSFSSLEILEFPGRKLVERLRGSDALSDEAWRWAAGLEEPRVFPPGAELPWGGETGDHALALVPIIESSGGSALGALALRRRVAPGRLGDALPAASSLASLVAAAIQRARTYELELEHQRVEQELAVAAEIQSSFMPRRAPDIEGWKISARIQSAREASGDFIDLIRLEGGRWGVLVADVSGKGVAAAIYMALARTVIRTYAHQESASPAAVLHAANRRILDDTDDEFFVTAFYGVLEPEAGRLLYASAGHEPAMLVGPDREHALESTGVPLGLLPDTAWTERSVVFAGGEVLSVHTDGVTDAQNGEGDFFGAQRLRDVLRSSAGLGARGIVSAVIEAVAAFAGETPQTDDMTVLILKRRDDGPGTGREDPGGR